MANTVPAFNDVAPHESSKPATSWGAIIAGGVGAAVAALVLMLVGSGLGLSSVSPFSNEGASLATIGVWTAIWLVITQWLSAGLGGYLAGRLRTKWVSVHTDEVFFRDTAHGFLAWAIGTLLVFGLLGSVIASVLGAGAQSAASIAGGAAQGATIAASETDSRSYFVDTLLRPADASRPTAEGQSANDEVSRILLNSAVSGQMLPEDRTYLEQIVAARASISPTDAKTRVDAVLARVDQAAQAAKDAADKARKAAATVALLGALSLIVGAFIASAAAALGGRLRDDEEDFRTRR